MQITFENDNDVVIYALEKIQSYIRDNHYIFLAQSIWWISSIIGLQQGLLIHIDNIREQANKAPINNASKATEIVHPSRRSNFAVNLQEREVSVTP